MMMIIQHQQLCWRDAVLLMHKINIITECGDLDVYVMYCRSNSVLVILDAGLVSSIAHLIDVACILDYSHSGHDK